MVEVISGKLKGDDLINFLAVYCRQVQQSRHRHTINNSLRGIPLKRDGHDFNFMATR
jgi:hypothetical protein